MIQLSPQASSIPFLICFSVRHIVTSVTLNAGCSRHILTDAAARQQRTASYCCQLFLMSHLPSFRQCMCRGACDSTVFERVSVGWFLQPAPHRYLRSRCTALRHLFARLRCTHSLRAARPHALLLSTVLPPGVLYLLSLPRLLSVLSSSNMNEFCCVCLIQYSRYVSFSGPHMFMLCSIKL